MGQSLRRQPPAVNWKRLPVDEPGRVGGEKEDWPEHVVEFSGATEGNAGQHPGKPFRIVEILRIQCSTDKAGSDGIDVDAARPPFDGEAARQLVDHSLAGRVGEIARPALKCADGRDVDDFAATPLKHPFANVLAGEDQRLEIDVYDILPHRHVEFGRRLEMHRPLAVDENVDAAKVPFYVGEYNS